MITLYEDSKYIRYKMNVEIEEFNTEKYPFIPKWKHKNLKSQSEELLHAANEYFKSHDEYMKLKIKLETEIEKMRLIQSEKKKMYIHLCPHDYVVQPREMYCSREWICSICGDTI